MLALFELGEFHTGLLIAADLRVAEMPARHEHTARRRTDGCAAVVLSEARALRGQPVYVWGGDILLPVAAEFAPAEVIRDDEDAIRTVGGEDGKREEQQPK